MIKMKYEELLKAYNALKAENHFLRTENETLRKQLSLPLPLDFEVFPDDTCPSDKSSVLGSKVHNNSSPKEKVALFISLFKGREDIYAKRWYSQKTQKGGYQPACENEWIHGLCNKKKYRCALCPSRKFSGLNELVIESHLKGTNAQGKDVVGIYPLLADENCYLL
ncbi:MAG: helicase, partial [bacterium]